MRPERRIELFTFLAAFFAFAYFNQGGGWNQNARFAEVRAIVEQGTPDIDDFLIYQRTGGPVLARIPIRNGDIERGGKVERLCWSGAEGALTPVNGIPPGDADGVTPVAVEGLACSGDVAFARGHFHPNKPPGASFVAVPAYFIILHIERLLGVNPDHWRALIVNAWLVSAFSVGLISALGCVVFLRFVKMLAPGHPRAAVLTAWTFAFGTLFFPFATLLFDHDLTATFLLAGFYGIFAVKEKESAARALFLSGLAAGLAAITNYVASAVVAMLGVYLLVTRLRLGRSRELAGRRVWRPALGGAAAFLLGVLGPLLAICAYNQVCFGSPFALSNSFQNPLFQDEGPTFLGMFGMPDAGVALALLVSPFRGLFYAAPALVLGLYGLARMWKTWRAEFWLILAVCALFFLVNVTFFGWHAGFSCGPRYLIPAIPFLALPMVFGWMRFPKITGALAAVSVAIHLLFTAVDAESPVGTGALAYVYDRPQWMQSPLTDYTLPLFTRGRAWPLLDELLRERLAAEDAQLAAEGMDAAERARRLDAMRARFRSAINRGAAQPFLLAAVRGPVSANPIAVFEGTYFALFPPGSQPVRWSSFNVGEFIFPHSRLSLLPLGLVAAALFAACCREAARKREAPAA